MTWNIQGLKTKLIDHDFVKFLNQYEIFSLSEIHNITYNEICKVFPNFEVFISYRTACQGGGVAVCVKRTILPFLKRIESDMEECVFLSFNEILFEKTVVMIFPYIAHEGSVFYENKLLNGIEKLEVEYLKIKEKVENSLCLICGDLNSRTGNLNEILLNTNVSRYLNGFDHCDRDDDIDIRSRKSRDKDTNNYGIQLVQFCKINDFVIINGRTQSDNVGNFTCIANKGRSVVDYCIIDRNFYDQVIDMNVLPRTESDHFPLSLKLKSNVYSDQNINSTYQPIQLTPIFKFRWNEKFKDIYHELLNEQLQLHLDEILELTKTNCEKAINKLDECILNAANQVKTKSTHNSTNLEQPPWFDNKCLMLKKDKYDKLHKFQSTGNEKDLSEYLKARKSFKSICRIKKTDFNEKKANELVKMFANSNSKVFWGELKSIINSKSKTINTSIHPAQWLTHFESLLKENINTGVTNDNFWQTDNRNYNESEDTLLNGPILHEEIIAGLKHLKNGKSAGCDGISSEFYKINNPVLINIIHAIFNKLFESGFYPVQWSKCMIVPLYKKGDMRDVKNYRGISLLNVMSKIFSYILNTRLKTWCDVNELLPEEQAGFRENYSTIDNIFNLNSLVQKYINKPRGRFYALYVDFKVCFDSLNRMNLWKILQKDGCNGKMLTMLKSMYQNVMMCVRVHKSEIFNCGPEMSNVNSQFFITDCFKSMSGVKQGCILSPLLFSLYIAELKHHFTRSTVRHVSLLHNDQDSSMLMYADDITIFADTVFDMQKKIDLLFEFCTNWGLTVNLDKTKMMVFRNGGYLKAIEKRNYGDMNIEVTTYYAYLGMIFSSRLCWTKTLDNCSCKALRMVGACLTNSKLFQLM